MFDDYLWLLNPILYLFSHISDVLYNSKNISNSKKNMLWSHFVICQPQGDLIIVVCLGHMDIPNLYANLSNWFYTPFGSLELTLNNSW